MLPNVTPDEARRPNRPADTYVDCVAHGVELHVYPRVMISWEEFLIHAPPNSIALDGYVTGPPRVVLNPTYINLNHHEGVDRLATRATCSQVLIYLKQDMAESLRIRGIPKFQIFINDPDQDTSLAVWLLVNHDRFRGERSEPLVNKLVAIEDLLDVTAGAYPLDPGSGAMQEIAWVFEPYTSAKVAGRIPTMAGAEMANVVSAVGKRIDRYTLGRAERLPLDMRYETLGGGRGWKLIREVGAHARTGLLADGIKAFVSLISENGGKYQYSIGMMSQFIPFPLERLFISLNRAEGLSDSPGNRWGGSNIIGGSPRLTASRLAPGEIEQIINAEVGELL